MKNKLALFVICLITVSFISGCNLINKPANETANNIKTVTHAEANIIDMQNSFNDLQNKSEICIVGKVKKNYSYKLYDTIFTNYVVTVERQIKKENNKIPDEIEVRFTGGTFENETESFLDEVKPLVVNNTYLFELMKVYPENLQNNYYGVLGGEYQGVFNATADSKDNVIKIKKFNENNMIEKQLLNNDVEISYVPDPMAKNGE